MKEKKEVKLKKRGPKFKYGKTKGVVFGLYTTPIKLKKLEAMAKKNKMSKSEYFNLILDKLIGA